MYYLFNVLLFITICRSSSFVFDRYSGKKVEIAQAKDLRLRNATQQCSMTVKLCTPHEGSRIDGTCNNFKYPSRGSAKGPYLRLLKPEYANNRDPRMTRHGRPLPSARKVRTELQTDGRVVDKHKFNIAGFHMLEFFNRDISALNGPRDYLRRRQYCCTPLGQADRRCFPIQVPVDDPYLKVTGIRCLNFSRAETFQDVGCTTEIIPPEQINYQTPVFDLSTVYGVDNRALRKVRKYEHGLLILEKRFDRYVPQNISSHQLGLSPDNVENIRSRIILKIKQDMIPNFKGKGFNNTISNSTNMWQDMPPDMLNKITSEMAEFLTDLMPEIMPDVFKNMLNKIMMFNITTSMWANMSIAMQNNWRPNIPNMMPKPIPDTIANIFNNTTMSNISGAMQNMTLGMSDMIPGPTPEMIASMFNKGAWSNWGNMSVAMQNNSTLNTAEMMTTPIPDIMTNMFNNMTMSNMTDMWANISAMMQNMWTPNTMPWFTPDMMGNMTTDIWANISQAMQNKSMPNMPNVMSESAPDGGINMISNGTMANMTTDMWANTSQTMPSYWESNMPNKMPGFRPGIMGSVVVDMLNMTAEILADTVANILANSMVNMLLDEISQYTPNVTDSICLQNNNTEPVCYQFGYPEVGNIDLRTTTLTIFFMREHNRIAHILQHLNPCWKDDRLFKVARQINIATASNILMYELLPLLLGFQHMVNSGLISEHVEHVVAYKDDEVPLVYAEYEIAARFFHTFVDGRVKTYKENYHYHDEYSFSDTLFRSGILEKGNILEEVTRGTFHQYAAKIDDIQDPEISETFYGMRLQRAHDWPSLDIQRGRDMGVRGYNDYRHMCGLKPAKKFEDFLDVMEIEKVEAMKKLYEVVDDVDLLAGIMSENHIQGIYVGPTLFCIMAKQLHLFRYSDRFWFERGDQMHSFSLEQLHEIRKTNMARFACDNADGIKHIQPQAFLNVKPGNMPVQCNHIPGPDLSKWRDETCFKHKYHHKATQTPIEYEHRLSQTSTFYGNREELTEYSPFFNDHMPEKPSGEIYQGEIREDGLRNNPFYETKQYNY